MTTPTSSVLKAPTSCYDPVHNIDPPTPLRPVTALSQIRRFFFSFLTLLLRLVRLIRQPFDELVGLLSERDRLLLFKKPQQTEKIYPPVAQTKRFKKKTLILDLDETLVHSGNRPWNQRQLYANAAGGFQVEVWVDGVALLYYVAKRPHVEYFLEKVTAWYNVMIFTASLPQYADPVIDWLDPDGRYFQKRYYRDACTPKGNSYIKDLSRLGLELRHVILVDNSALAYAMHRENGVSIESWLDDAQDEGLLDLLPLLDGLRFVDDVRSIIGLGLYRSSKPLRRGLLY